MKERLTRSEAIRLKCLDCMCGQMAEVRECPCEDCPLWRYRMGYEVGDGKVVRPRKEKESAN